MFVVLVSFFIHPMNRKVYGLDWSSLYLIDVVFHTDFVRVYFSHRFPIKFPVGMGLMIPTEN